MPAIQRIGDHKNFCGAYLHAMTTNCMVCCKPQADRGSVGAARGSDTVTNMSRPKRYMPSWVRYSLAVYMGLLLAGSLVEPKPNATADTSRRYEGAADLLIVRPHVPTLREKMQRERESRERQATPQAPATMD
jgi:hypothetical protein